MTYTQVSRARSRTIGDIWNAFVEMMKTVPLEEGESFRTFVIGECRRLEGEHHELADGATYMDRRLRHRGIAQSMQAIANFDPTMRRDLFGSAQACVQELRSCNGVTIRPHVVANLRLCMLLGKFDCTTVGCTIEDLAVPTKESAVA